MLLRELDASADCESGPYGTSHSSKRKGAKQIVTIKHDPQQNRPWCSVYKVDMEVRDPNGGGEAGGVMLRQRAAHGKFNYTYYRNFLVRPLDGSNYAL